MWSVVLLAAVAAACGASDDATAPGPTLSELSLFPEKRAAAVGDIVSFSVTARDLAGNVVSATPTFTSTNSAVAAILQGGIEARGVGTTIIRATAGGKVAEATLYVGPATYDYAALGAPRVVTANYIDLAKIERISRFRSGVGHSYDDGSETCRSMKHYFQPKTMLDWTTVDVFAPAEGTVMVVRPDGSYGKQILMRTRQLPILYIAIFHVEPDAHIVPNAWLNAGDHVGRHSSGRTYSDIALSIGPTEGGRLISYFDAMTDAVWQLYQARGVTSRSAMIITKAERDADPIPCVGDSQFTSFGTLPNWVVLN